MDIAKLNEKLIELYSLFLIDTKSKKLKDEALEIYNKYSGASTFLKKETALALNRLIDIVADTGVQPPSKEEAKMIIKGLKQNQ